MKGTTTLMALVGVMVLGAGPVGAQIKNDRNELHLFAGGLWGDYLTDRSVSGDHPQLDSNVRAFGLRYDRHLNSEWSLEAAAGYNLDTATNLPGGDVNLDILTADLDAMWHFRPQNKVVGYAIGGVGYARANLERPIRGTVQGQSVSINDEGGFTANAGIGAKIFMTEALMIRAESRYRFINRLVDRFGDSLNVVETTVGVGWQY